MILIPLPSPDCAKDWNYNEHGEDWKCRCNEGFEQSPIALEGADSCSIKLRRKHQNELNF